MEPVLPPSGSRFEAAAVALHREAAALAASAHPVTLAALARLVRVVNAYYSNLIEGVRTTPVEIERAMRADYAHDPRRAAVQRLAAAHVRIEAAIGADLAARPSTPVTSPEFVRGLHRHLYEDVPAAERVVRSPAGREAVVAPGELRTENVSVGSHLAPPPSALPGLLARFDEAYRPDALSEVTRVVAFAASHHRLAWIHPFLDGNGRVTRLFSVAYARRIGLDAGGLWSIARGFARHRAEYYAMLARADEPRRSDFDECGALSLAGLEAWCDFVVRVALDQIAYMRSLLVPDTLADRLRGYAAYRSAASPDVSGGGAWRSEAGELLAALVWRGEMPRGEALRYLPGRERTARAALSALLRDGIVVSDSHRAPVRLAFPPEAAAVLFPDLAALPERRAEGDAPAETERRR
jgi:Fic family protein